MTSEYKTRLYQRVITSSNRLQQLKALDAPDLILRNEKRILRDSIRALGDILAPDDVTEGGVAELARAA